jgi:hypothetical protein
MYYTVYTRAMHSTSRREQKLTKNKTQNAKHDQVTKKKRRFGFAKKPYLCIRPDRETITKPLIFLVLKQKPKYLGALLRCWGGSTMGVVDGIRHHSSRLSEKSCCERAPCEFAVSSMTDPATTAGRPRAFRHSG